MGEARSVSAASADGGLIGLAIIAGHYRIASDPFQMRHELGLGDRPTESDDLIRAAHLVGLKARKLSRVSPKRLASIPLPAMIGGKDGSFAVLAAGRERGVLRLLDPVQRGMREMKIKEIAEWSTGEVVLVTRRLGGAGADPNTFSFAWFLPSIWRYRKALADVFVASLFVQIFGLITPLFFQLVVDKVLVHKGHSTLVVLAIGLVVLGVFEGILQYLRTYMLTHTTNRMDVELGRRLFHHLFRLPLSYFETRPAGQTVARVRELETIRNFLTGQGLTSCLDLIFTLIFIAVLFLYSVELTLVVLASIPVYILIGTLIRPPLRDQIKEKFNRGAQSQQLLVESIIGVQTIKAASVEPMMQVQWEDRLAGYVRTSFDATMLGTLGQNLIRGVSKIVTALIIYLGAEAVIDTQLTVGGLIAFNMISGQVVAPILRLSQLWQDFQQVQISVERLGDILNAPMEPTPRQLQSLPPLSRRDRAFQHHLPLQAQHARHLEKPLLDHQARRSDRHRRALGLRQIHDHQARAKALHAGGRASAARRRRHRAARPELGATADRRRAAREPPLQSHDPRQHRAFRPRHAAQPRDGGRRARGRS